MHLPAALCKMQRKKRETDGFSKSTWMTPPGSHPTSGFGARHGLPKFFRHKKRRIVQKRCGKLVDLEGFEPLTSRMRTERSPSNIAFVHTSCTARKEKSTYIRPYERRGHADRLSWLQVWSPSRGFSR